MPVDIAIYPPLGSSYALFEMYKTNHPMAYFDSLSGGDQTIALVTYNVIDPMGHVTTKYMPGQTTYAPVTLLRSMNKFSEEVNQRFVNSFMGKLKVERQNYSICLFDGQKNELVWWHLLNAIPSRIGGFRLSGKEAASYAEFELTLQPESIYIQFGTRTRNPLP